MPVQQDALGAALTELRPSCSFPVRRRLSGAWQQPFPGDVLTLHLLVRGSGRVELDEPVWTWRFEERTLLVANRGLRGRITPTSTVPAKLLSTELHLGGEDRHSLLALLPPVMLIHADRIPAPRSFRSTLDALEDELEAPSHAHRFVLAQLFLVLFVASLRVHILELAWNDRGWFRALVDPSLQAPLHAAARTSAVSLSVAGLASQAHRSRQRFGGRFRAILGTTPGSFVRRTRLLRATELLEQGVSSLEVIAREVGLSGRQSLCRAFRRELGTTPAAYWRKVHRRRFPKTLAAPAEVQKAPPAVPEEPISAAEEDAWRVSASHPDPGAGLTPRRGPA